MDKKLLMTASSRNDDEVVSFSDTSRRNDDEMAVRKGFPSGRAHSAHLLRYASSMMASGMYLVAKPCIWTKWARLIHHFKVVSLLEKNPCEMVVIIGHSLGADTAIEVAQSLKRKGYRVDVLVQIDSKGIGDEQKPGNVGEGVNIYTGEEDSPGIDGASHVEGSRNIPIFGTSHREIDKHPTTWEVIDRTVMRYAVRQKKWKGQQ